MSHSHQARLLLHPAASLFGYASAAAPMPIKIFISIQTFRNRRNPLVSGLTS